MSFFFRISWKIQTILCRCAVTKFSCWLQRTKHSHFLRAKQLKLWALIYIFIQRKKFWGWQQRVVFACRTAAFKEHTSFFLFLDNHFIHAYLCICHKCAHSDRHQPIQPHRAASCCFSVRGRKLSCDRRDCEAGCWRFICSGGTAGVAGVKLLHLLAPKVLRNLVKCQFLRDSDAGEKRHQRDLSRNT